MTARFRYEDVTQDGRAILTALPLGVSLTAWEQLILPDPRWKTLLGRGVLPILHRLVIEGGDSPVSVGRPFEVRGCYQLAHTVDGGGEVNRLLLNIWCETTAPIGRTYGPPPPNAGEITVVGRVRAEHVITRPLGAKDQRKVLRLDVEGLPAVPPTRMTVAPAEQLISIPRGAELIDETLLPDEAPLLFGLVHTDSNQHVNSLVFLRSFEEAALRRLAAHGRATKLLARRAEIAFRKPFFAGERARIHLQAFSLEGRLGALGTFTGEPPASPHSFVRMMFG
ncbi:MAG: hypothetical protein HY698_14100 [Deltaproteobacteria bacterium]|nr:hypothetical protein [Deltaproteobacteria bacterium]